jgi:GT2 family glycosyltransferase
MHDLSVIVVSHNSRRWLVPALTSVFEHAGPIDLDVILVDNGTDGSAEYVSEVFPAVRTVSCSNHGFGHANNRGLEMVDARYVLFLNPDTEILSGQLNDLVSILDRRPDVAVAGARQVGPDDSLSPSIRRFPSSANTVAEAVGIERIPLARRVLGERELDPCQYDLERSCDWTPGSFMLTRTAALAGTGGFDERFFLFSEETDLCYRLRHKGWQVVHLPYLTIRHDESDGQENPKLEAQGAYARVQFARKHFSSSGAFLYRVALAFRYALRLGLYSTLRREDRGRREAVSAALAAVITERPPFGG